MGFGGISFKFWLIVLNWFLPKGLLTWLLIYLSYTMCSKNTFVFVLTSNCSILENQVFPFRSTVLGVRNQSFIISFCSIIYLLCGRRSFMCSSEDFFPLIKKGMGSRCGGNGLTSSISFCSKNVLQTKQSCCSHAAYVLAKRNGQ